MSLHEQIMKLAGLEDVKKSTVLLRILTKTDSLKPAIGWIEDAIKQHNLSANDIVLGFDVDGTLTDLDPTKKGIKKGDTALRGGADSRQLFTFLDSKGIKWFALSGRASSVNSTQGVASSIINQLELKTPQWSIESSAGQCVRGTNRFGGLDLNVNTKKEIFRHAGKTYNAFQCNNIISLVQPGQDYAFDKDASLEYAISVFSPSSYPKLIVFFDDNAKNVMTMFNYFNSGEGSKHDVIVICALFDPHKPEDDHAEWFEQMSEIMK